MWIVSTFLAHFGGRFFWPLCGCSTLHAPSSRHQAKYLIVLLRVLAVGLKALPAATNSHRLSCGMVPASCTLPTLPLLFDLH